MKQILLLLFLVTSSLLNASTYYVATADKGGSDSNPGTFNQPFNTWLYGFRHLNTGDTLYIRGGVYNLRSQIYLTSQIGGQGTLHDPICVFAYPGENPILDCNALNATSGWDISGKNHWIFRGLTVRHVYQDGQPVKVNAIGVSNCNNVHLINCSTHDNGGSGFVFSTNDTIYIRNCDSYNNCDSLGQPGGELGGKADGFQMYCYDCTTDTDKWQITYFDQCRAWNNSDDGWDFLRNTKAVVDSCWAIYNGYPLNGSGQGIKAGLAQYDPPSGQYVFTNNIAVYNKDGGFRDNSNSMPSHIDSRWYNNIAAFNAGRGFSSSIGTGYMATNIWTNNISYANVTGDWWEDISVLIHENNSWNLKGITLNNDDFQSVDSTGITAPRQPDGSLPANDCYSLYLRLNPTSELVDAGKYVGLPFYGNSSDLGAFEYAPVPVTNVINPSFVGGKIENALPSRLEMTYNMTLANIVPATSAFTVRVNSVTRSVSGVVVSGSKVLLTLSSPVIYGDVVTVAYTKPAYNPLQTPAGGQAASLSQQNVINNVAPLNPTFVNAVIENAQPSRLEMTYNMTLASIVPATSAFTVRVNSVTRSVSGVVVSGSKVLLTLSSPVVYGDAVTVTYTKPVSNPLQSSLGSQAASITDQSVINNCIQPNLPPEITISSPTKSTSFVAPATITIYATASDKDGNISRVEFYSGSSKIGEKSEIPYTFTWKEVSEGTYYITAVATDDKGLRTTSEVVTAVVEKSASTVNQLPAVSITANTKEKKHPRNDKIMITASANDPDGKISKVELKNGNITLVEMTSPPYVYLWEPNDTGTFFITAIATDNLGASNVSSNLEFLIFDPDKTDPDLINLYPNPNNGQFSINLPGNYDIAAKNVHIVDYSGKIVFEDTLTEEAVSTDFYLSYIAPGPYVLVLTDGKRIVATKRFIKK